ncbi:hypothetical protein MtrunA17_Chr3g0111981 [Medicago truncatula]|uniref:Transmembrane protein n=1 Tax=Medicago truncatula TaxID=3880 RepID=A0A396IRQ5_MEDTR|nr:hypothetical protein MtrunA17_Chr3g0111981 [Medicago truncatula]
MRVSAFTSWIFVVKVFIFSPVYLTNLFLHFLFILVEKNSLYLSFQFESMASLLLL